MSIHPSLRQATGKAGILRNVLKRHERVRDLLATGRFAEGSSVYGLPKTKQLRLKVRKAAKEAVAGAEAGKAPSGGKPPAGGKTAEGTAAAAPAAKAAPGAKPPSGGKPPVKPS